MIEFTEDGDSAARAPFQGAEPAGFRPPPVSPREPYQRSTSVAPFQVVWTLT